MTGHSTPRRRTIPRSFSHGLRKVSQQIKPQHCTKILQKTRRSVFFRLSSPSRWLVFRSSRSCIPQEILLGTDPEE